MISSIRRCGDRPLSARMREIMSTRLPRRNCTGERLAATLSCGGQPAASAQARRRTHSPIELIKPLSSASGMKSAGAIGPRSGWRQRISASTSVTSLVRMSTMGW